MISRNWATKLKEPWEVHNTFKKGGFYDRSGAEI